MELGGLLAFRVVPALYFVAWLLYLPVRSAQRQRADAFASAALAVAVSLHVAGLLVLTLYRHVAPPANLGESLSYLALATSLIYLYVETRSGQRGMGVFAAFLISALAFGSALVGPAEEISDILLDVFFAPHAATIIIAFSSFSISAMLSFAYLAKYRQLRNKQSSGLIDRLPPLEALDAMSRRSMRMGFLFLTVGLAIGMVLADRVWGQAWSWDPKQCMTLVTWLLYGLALTLRRMRDWQGGRSASANLIAFASVILGMFIMYGIFDTAHRFG